MYHDFDEPFINAIGNVGANDGIHVKPITRYHSNLTKQFSRGGSCEKPAYLRFIKGTDQGTLLFQAYLYVPNLSHLCNCPSLYLSNLSNLSLSSLLLKFVCPPFGSFTSAPLSRFSNLSLSNVFLSKLGLAKLFPPTFLYLLSHLTNLSQISLNLTRLFLSFLYPTFRTVMWEMNSGRCLSIDGLAVLRARSPRDAAGHRTRLPQCVLHTN